MKIIIIGRTINLLNSARELQNLGHSIVGVITSKSSAEDKVNENISLFAPRSLSTNLNIHLIYSFINYTHFSKYYFSL